MAESYVRPEVLVETAWVAEHLEDPRVRIVESDEDILLYDVGHIPGAVKMDWFTQLQQQVRRDFLDRPGMEALLSQAGIANDTTVVFYGDKSNWFACYAFWIFQLFGHDRAKVMNGGRKKWTDEGRPLTKEVPRYAPTTYRAQEPYLAIRAFRDQVLAHIGQGALVDVRSPKEYTGELIHMEGYPQEGAQRGGHIPTAVNIPWAMAVREADWTFKPADELRALYTSKGITPDEDIIAYCRIGERSSLTWFVLTYLLGYPRVRNYDGSWTEWGNLRPRRAGDRMTREERVEFLVDHSKRQRNRKVLPDASFVRSGGNPGCGDLVTIYGRVEGDRLARMTFEAEGCTLSQAAASIVTEMASGLTLTEAEQLSYDALFDMTGRDLAMSRIRCATMALDTLKQALRGYAVTRLLEVPEATRPPP